MSFAREPTQEQGQRCVSADNVQAKMQLVNEHRQVEMMLYGDVCSSSRVCAGVCEVVSTVSCNETCRIDIRSIDD